MKGNQYSNNMAYFEGNAVYIEGCSNVSANGETYRRNYGLTGGIGGALTLGGVDLGLSDDGNDEDQTPLISIVDSVFDENFAGQRGSAINVGGGQGVDISIQECTFTKNGGIYSFLEVELEMTFWKYLANEQFPLNYFPFMQLFNKEPCSDEFQFIGNCQTNAGRSRRFAVRLPQAKGAIYAQNVDTITIIQSEFTENDPGPLLDNIVREY